MTALEERCGELTTNLKILESVTKNQGIQDQIEALVQKTTTLVDNSTKLKAQLVTMINDGLCVDVKWGDVSIKLNNLDDRTAKVLGKLKASPEKINDGRDWPECERLAHEAAKDLRTILKSKWKDFITLKTLNRVSVLHVPRELAQYREAIRQLESLETKARSLLDVLPQTPEDVTVIIQIDEKMTGLINGLGTRNEPKEMIEFLNRCASGDGVPLSELSDERLAWLRAKGFEQSLRVRR
jgi:DNA-directed RNA polymerase subunit F